MDQAQLFCHINEVSFAVVDSALYLDTHPHDCDALAYNREMVAMRNAALKVYARRFGPLTIDCTEEVTSNSWVWILQPWPWEAVSKGGCR
ncbi:MAG: spore coat protein CotJB [Eubacteriales bacterium]|nr:spore coat protein CotJB [Eubacteriales bacterium]